MLKLQAKGVESVAWEERILARAGRSGFAALATASSLDELREKARCLRRAAVGVRGRERPDAGAGPPAGEGEADRAVRAARGARARRAGAGARPGRACARPSRRCGAACGSPPRRGARGPARGSSPCWPRSRGYSTRCPAPTRGGLGPRSSSSRGRSPRDFADKLASFQKNLTPRAVVPGDAPPELRQRYVGSSGRYLLRIQPAVDIWQRAGAERFVTDLRRVDPDVTGPPITSYEAIRFIRHGLLPGHALRAAAGGARHRRAAAERARHRAGAVAPRAGRRCGRSASCTCSASSSTSRTSGRCR